MASVLPRSFYRSDYVASYLFFANCLNHDLWDYKINRIISILLLILKIKKIQVQTFSITLYLSVMNNNFFQLNNEIPWQDLGNGVERQLFGYDDKIMMVKVRFQEGAVGAVHQHPHVQVSYVESGQFELTIGDDVKTLSKGDGYFVPPNILHGCVCKQAGVLVDTFTPLREDFLG